MKKCPKCHADIEDNARFCVFCMSSLQEKEKIEDQQKSNKRWPYILAALLLLTLILGISIFALSKNKLNNSSSESLPQSAVISDSDSSYSNSSSASIPSTENSSKTTTDNSVVDQTDNNSHHTSSEITNSTDKTPSVTTPSNSTPVSSSGNTTNNSPSQSEPSKSEDTDSKDQSIENPSSSASTTEDENKTDISIYEYRDAQKSDYTGYEIDNAVVITKVISPAPNGLYVIPDKINGKTVVAIMDNAFGNENVKNTVKTVVIPATIRTVWGNAFFACHNLTDLYIKGDGFYVYDNFFPPVQRRNATITIHSSAICRDTKTSVKFSLLADYNNALFELWDGKGI